MFYMMEKEYWDDFRQCLKMGTVEKLKKTYEKRLNKLGKVIWEKAVGAVPTAFAWLQICLSNISVQRCSYVAMFYYNELIISSS